MLLGLCGLCVGTYAVLDRTAPRVLALPMLALGVVAAAGGLVGAGSRVVRSRYRPDPWRLPEWLVLGSGVLAATVAVVAAQHDVLAAYPALDAWPPLTVTHLTVAALALAGGLAAPVPARADLAVVRPVAVAR
jgi:energy-coupling factor transport system permease protein